MYKEILEKIEAKLKDINPLRYLISKKPVEAVKRQKEEIEEDLEKKLIENFTF